MKLYVSWGNKVTGEWQQLEAIALKSGPALYDPERPAPLPQQQVGLKDEEVILPSGEALSISVAYDQDSKGISINVFCGEDHLLQVGGFKQSEKAYDPNVILRSPQGVHVSLMVGV